MLVIQQPERQQDGTWLVHWQDNQNKINHAYYRDLENALNKIIYLNKLNNKTMYYIKTKARKNSKTYGKTIASFETEQEVLNYLEAKNVYFESTPYFFTHINLTDGSIITQTVIIGSDKKEITCSPEALSKSLIIQKACHQNN